MYKFSQHKLSIEKFVPIVIMLKVLQIYLLVLGSCDLSSYYFLIIWLTIPVTLVILMALFYPVTLYGIVRYKSKKSKPITYILY